MSGRKPGTVAKLPGPPREPRSSADLPGRSRLAAVRPNVPALAIAITYFPQLRFLNLPPLSRLCGRGAGGEGLELAKCRRPSPLTPLPQSRERGTGGIAHRQKNIAGFAFFLLNRHHSQITICSS